MNMGQGVEKKSHRFDIKSTSKDSEVSQASQASLAALAALVARAERKFPFSALPGVEPALGRYRTGTITVPQRMCEPFMAQWSYEYSPAPRVSPVCAQDDELLAPIDQEDDGVIILHQLRPEENDHDRVKIKKEDVLMAYSRLASELPAYPPLPQHGFGAQSMYGDWYIYNDYSLCKQFEADYEWVHVYIGESTRIPLRVSIKKLTIDKVKDGKISSAQVDMMSLHIGIKVPNGPLFRHINTSMLVDYFKGGNFATLKQNRAGVKFNGERIRAAGLSGEMIHLNIRPYDGDVFGAFYPPQIELMVMGTRQYLDYKIFDHPEVDGLICKMTCHRYKAHSYQQLNAIGKVPRHWCICDESQKSKPGKPRGAGPSGMAAFLAALGEHKAQKGQNKCKHFDVGKCYAVGGGKGVPCAFLHEGSPDKITCELGAQCKGPPRCKYAHPTPDETMYACTPPYPPWEPD